MSRACSQAAPNISGKVSRNERRTRPLTSSSVQAGRPCAAKAALSPAAIAAQPSTSVLSQSQRTATGRGVPSGGIPLVPLPGGGEDVKAPPPHRPDCPVADRLAVDPGDRLHEGGGGGQEGLPRPPHLLQREVAFLEVDAELG